ncbi:unnamed protein product [Moneuplotes crassus]|uniref:Uncharacterized protein n=1 Tax=Euplotes crassus TaxID=5936 RepID=A0AAD2CWX5_EUPCR|nr:unnamed protein product [Moneuplotes crassus]
MSAQEEEKIDTSNKLKADEIGEQLNINEGLSPEIERNRPNHFTEIEHESVPISKIEQVFNNENDDGESGFGATPSSITLLHKDSVQDSFRVALFVFDFLQSNQKIKEIVDDSDDEDLSIFLDDIDDKYQEQTNLLMTTQDINIFAKSKDELEGPNQIVMDSPPPHKEITSEVEEEFQAEVVQRRKKKTMEELEMKNLNKKTKITTDPRVYKASLTPQAIMYFRPLFSQLLFTDISFLLLYNDEYINSISQPDSLTNLDSKDNKISLRSKKWMDYLNVSICRSFIIKEAGLGSRTGGDDLGLSKYNSYELYTNEMLNKIILKKHRRGKEAKKKLLPFLGIISEGEDE